jgi:hypothetical protein
MAYSRDATENFKGYEYQYYYFIKIIVEDFNNINYIIFEGCEDIDIMYKNNKYKIIQVKYHTTKKSKEGFGKHSGLTKVINAYMNDYKDNNNNSIKNKNEINEILYLVNNENILDSPKFKELCNNNYEYNLKLLSNKYTKYINNIEDFTKKLKVINIDNKNISTTINEILESIDTSDFYNFGSNHEYKKELVLCKLTKNIIEHIGNSTKKELYLNNLFDEIKKQLDNNYTIDYLVQEIISGLNSENHIIKYQFEQIMTNNFLSKLNLKYLYQLLNKSNDNINNNIKFIIINKILKQINNVNDINYSNFKYIIGHLHNLVNKKSTINGTQLIDVLDNINKLKYCSKYNNRSKIKTKKLNDI